MREEYLLSWVMARLRQIRWDRRMSGWFGIQNERPSWQKFSAE
jgi:hypothetical protein